MRLKSEKYSIAWFKLAELVSRREKERALGLYRLLFHALEDKAFGYQLEGDLLFAFSDKDVIKSYYKAAALYEREGKIAQAVSLYESMHALAPEKVEYSLKLVELYQQANNYKKIKEAYKALIYSYVLNECWIQVDNLIKKDIEKEDKVKFYGYICISMLNKSSSDFVCSKDKEKFKYYLDKTLKVYLNDDAQNVNNKELQNFILNLKNKNDKAYKLACKILEEPVL